MKPYLGSGLLNNAAKKLKGRKSKIEAEVKKAMGKPMTVKDTKDKKVSKIK